MPRRRKYKVKASEYSKNNFVLDYGSGILTVFNPKKGISVSTFWKAGKGLRNTDVRKIKYSRK